MKIKFLGTAAAEGWPAVFCQCSSCKKAWEKGGKNIRTRSSCLIDDELLIDFPPDTYMHVLQQKLDLSKIQHLIVTHSHQDHFYPLDLVMRKEPFAHIYDGSPLHVYGNNKVVEKYNQDCGDEKVSGKILQVHEIEAFTSFQAGNAKIIPLLAKHDPSEKCLIYIIELGGKRLLYGHDTGFFPEATWDAIKPYRFDAVILDCTTGQHKDGKNHMGIQDNVEVKEELLKRGNVDERTKLIVTHFSHNGGLLHDELIDAVKPYNFEVAFDGAEFNI